MIKIGVRRLKDLIVEEISIVDKPAVPDARWIILKRLNPNDDPNNKKREVDKMVDETNPAISQIAIDINKRLSKKLSNFKSDTLKFLDEIENSEVLQRTDKDDATNKIKDAIIQIRDLIADFVVEMNKRISELETIAAGYGYVETSEIDEEHPQEEESKDENESPDENMKAAPIEDIIRALEDMIESVEDEDKKNVIMSVIEVLRGMVNENEYPKPEEQNKNETIDKSETIIDKREKTELDEIKKRIKMLTDDWYEYKKKFWEQIQKSLNALDEINEIKQKLGIVESKQLKSPKTTKRESKTFYEKIGRDSFGRRIK